MSTKSNSSQASHKSSNASSGDHEIESGPFARLCHLKKWPHFQGYGFNLHAERSKLGQHIGKVDADSPADSAGLKEGDRIIEVNNVNISNENHQQVVKRIRNGLDLDGKSFPDQVILLVVDTKADEYYKKMNLVPRHDMKNVIKFVTPDASPVDKEDKVDKETPTPVKASDSAAYEEKIVSKLTISTINNSIATASVTDIDISNVTKPRRSSNSSGASDSSHKKVATPPPTKTATTKSALNSSSSTSSRTSTASNSKIHNLASESSSKENSLVEQSKKEVRHVEQQKENSLPITPESSNNSKVNGRFQRLLWTFLCGSYAHSHPKKAKFKPKIPLKDMCKGKSSFFNKRKGVNGGPGSKN